MSVCPIQSNYWPVSNSFILLWIPGGVQVMNAIKLSIFIRLLNLNTFKHSKRAEITSHTDRLGCQPEPMGQIRIHTVCNVILWCQYECLKAASDMCYIPTIWWQRSITASCLNEYLGAFCWNQWPVTQWLDWTQWYFHVTFTTAQLWPAAFTLMNNRVR